MEFREGFCKIREPECQGIRVSTTRRLDCSSRNEPLHVTVGFWWVDGTTSNSAGISINYYLCYDWLQCIDGLLEVRCSGVSKCTLGEEPGRRTYSRIPGQFPTRIPDSLYSHFSSFIPGYPVANNRRQAQSATKSVAQTQRTANMGLFPDYMTYGNSLQGWVQYQVSKLNGNLTGAHFSSSGSSETLAFSVSRYLPSLAGLIFAWFLGSCLWYRYLSPISDIPGPFLASFSRLWLIQALRRGRAPRELLELHEKYGE